MSKSLASLWQGSPQICCFLFSNFPSTDPLYPACWSCKSPAVFALLGVEFSFTEAPIAIVLNKICLYSVKLVSNSVSFWEMFELFQNIEKHENLHSSFNEVKVTQIATNKQSKNLPLYFSIQIPWIRQLFQDYKVIRTSETAWTYSSWFGGEMALDKIHNIRVCNFPTSRQRM